VTADLRSLRTWARLSAIEVHEGSGGRAVRVRLRPLGGQSIALRPSTSDADTVWGTFARRYHLPPPELDGIRTIWDLGANIGLTMADLAERHPGARVLGVELDADNADLARLNTAPWGERCEVVHAAVWPEDGEVRYERWAGGTASYRAEGGPDRAPAVSLDTLLREHGGPVDYLKVDVEGAERRLLRERAAWAHSVRCLKVEVHDPYTVEECERDLRALGFETEVDPRHWACVIGRRR
jgi:FkbM family methyltransferase